MSGIERQRVTKRKEPHPADVLADNASAQSPAKPSLRVPTLALSPAVVRQKRPPPAVLNRKVATSWRMPRRLLDRLECGAVEILAAVGHRVSKNQIVEDALSEYLTKFGISGLAAVLHCKVMHCGAIPFSGLERLFAICNRAGP